MAVEKEGFAEEILLELASLDAGNFARTLKRVLKLDAQILEVDRVNFWIFEHDPAAIICLEGYMASQDSYEAGQRLYAADHPRYFDAILSERIVAADDAHRDPRTTSLLESYLRPLGIAGLLDAPVWLRGTLAGVLCHEQRGPPRRWSAKEKQLAVFVAQTLARVLEARQRSLATLLYDATILLTESLDLTEVPKRLARLLVPLLGDWCVIDVFDEGALRRLAGTHLDERRRPLLDKISSARGEPVAATARAVAAREAVLLRDLDEEILRALGVGREQAQALMTLGAGTLLAVPFSAHGQVLGAITIGSEDPARPYPADDLALASQLAERAAVALENARLYHKVEDALRLREEFLSIAAHELYTPIQALQFAIDAIDSGHVPLSQQAVARSIAVAQRQVRRLARLVEDLLSVTRMRTGKLTLALERVDLVSVVRDVVGQYQREIEQSGSEVTIEAERALVGIWDRDRLEQVVSNLLGNAVKFGGGEPIKVRVERAGDRARLVVRNRGVGIDQEKLRVIFEPFRRAVSARRYSGLGLGLYIVRQIVEAFGGDVSATSTPEEGTAFVAELPLQQPRERPPAPADGAGDAGADPVAGPEHPLPT